MKILLFGEFSALHLNLKDGLLELGHECVIASTGDGFKKIDYDIKLNSSLPSYLGFGITTIMPLLKKNKLKNFDIVQFVNPFVLNHKYFPVRYFLNYLKRNNSKLFLLAAGSDSYYWTEGREKLRYGPFNDEIKYDLNSEEPLFISDLAKNHNDLVIDFVNGIIPVLYEYELSYNKHPKRLNTIPLPINVDKIKFSENKLNGKLKVFHGLNRYGFKGTRYVEEAFMYLQSKYPNDLDLRICGGLPLNSYLSEMEKANVVIDQVNSYSVGMNGLLALAQGKIVLSGAEEESLKSQKLSSSPVFNITPDSLSIINSIEHVLDQRSRISEIGSNGRRFVEENHHYIKIAQMYLNTWKTNY